MMSITLIMQYKGDACYNGIISFDLVSTLFSFEKEDTLLKSRFWKAKKVSDL